MIYLHIFTLIIFAFFVRLKRIFGIVTSLTITVKELRAFSDHFGCIKDQTHESINFCTDNLTVCLNFSTSVN